MPTWTGCLAFPHPQKPWLKLFKVLIQPCLFRLPQLEEQISRLQREKNDLQSRFEEDQEDMNELMKKHKAAVAQVTSYIYIIPLF